MRILIADDHAVVQKGLVQLLTEELPDSTFACAATFPETLESIRRECFDLALLDLFMPGGNCFAVLHEARLSRPWLPILVLGSAPEEELGLRVLRAGASGYLNKQSTNASLLEAVRKLLAGGRYVGAHLAEQLAAEACHLDHPLHEDLSDREFQIMHLVVEGESLKEIACELSLSVKTVRTFHARLLAKLHLQSDVALVHYALNHGLVEPRATS
jgi:DNA-binding NarL/FixJ family response regulator